MRFKPIRAVLPTCLLLLSLSTPAADWRDIQAISERQQEQLSTKIESLILENATLDEAIAQLQEKTKVNLVLDWQDLERDGFKITDRITLQVKTTTLAKALNMVLAAFGDGHRPLSTRVEDGVVRIVSPLSAVNPVISTRVYDVADFTARFIVPNELHPNLRSSGLFSSGLIPSEHLWQMSRSECMQAIVEIITELVDRDSWDQTHTITESGGLLIVRQRPENHRLIETLLKNLRKFRQEMDDGAPINPSGIDFLAR